MGHAMPVLFAIVLLALLPSHAQSYRNMAEAIADSSTASRLGQLPEPAVKYIIDACSLGWDPCGPTTSSRGGTDVRAYVSANRGFCLLSRAGWSEWGQWGDAEYALARADAGLLWRKSGTVAADPAVSNLGAVALFLLDGDAQRHVVGHVQLVLLSAAGDTIARRLWVHDVDRPMQRTELNERYGFSPDGEVFFTTMNTAVPDSGFAVGYNNTILHGFELHTGLEHLAALGPFWPQSLKMFPDHADLTGRWQARMNVFDDQEFGYYRIVFPWRVVKTTTDHDAGRR